MSERLHAEAVALVGSGRLAEAHGLYRAALDLAPESAVLLGETGLLCAHLERFPEAEALLRRALRVKPERIDVRFNLAVVLAQQGSEDAIEQFEQVLAADPRHMQARLGLAGALEAASRPEEALGHYRRALQIEPDFAPALANLALLLVQLGELQDARVCCQHLVRLRPNASRARQHLGDVLCKLGRFDEALIHLEAALALDAGNIGALLTLGNVHHGKRRLEAAARCYQLAVTLQPGYARAHINLGHVRWEQGQADDAIAHFARAADLEPRNAHARVAHIMAQLPVAYRDETEIAARRTAYAAGLQAFHDEVAASAQPRDHHAGIGALQPFYLPYQGDNDRALQHLYGATVCRIMKDQFGAAPMPPLPRQDERIRVGFVSGFMRRHSVWKVPVQGWLSQLDRTKFQLLGYHTDSEQDAATETARNLCERFAQGPLPLDRWRREILADRPHVLIYPEIGMHPMAVQLAAQRLAPVQCNSWGQPTTSGFPTLDYFLSSALMEPPDAEMYYSERLVRLPGLSVHYEPYCPAPDAQSPDRAEFGLRPDAVVYWCGQAAWKYLPQHDWVFARIARDVGDCQFAFIAFTDGPYVNAVFAERMRLAFAAEGLCADDHVVVLPHMPKDRFVSSFAVSDVFLDSLGWSGFNTAMESLVHDLPIVTTAGRFMRGRHCLAILRVMEIDDMIAQTGGEYCDIAVRLGRDPALRQDVGQRIAANKHRLYRDRAAITGLEAFLIRAVQDPPIGQHD